MEPLRSHLARITHLNQAAAVLEWDMETYMPTGGAEARSKQVATLRSMAHELLVSDETASLLDRAKPTSAIDEDLVRVVLKDAEKASRVPSSLIAALAEASGRAKGAWQEARSTNTFALFAPHLERIVDLCIQHAEALGYTEQPYDALLDQYEEGATTQKVSDVFEEVRSQLVPFVKEITGTRMSCEGPLHREYPEAEQWAFGLRMAERIGYDLDHGRQDRSAHPFSTSFSTTDVRITTRLEERFFNPAFFGTLHEAGHAIYEQGIDPALEGTPLADGTSLGMHESQSRLWENLIGRSLPFWEYAYPEAQKAFPQALSDVSLDAFYRAINSVSPSTIRVEADEVTYNLHIMLRFELEQKMITGAVAVADLPQEWNDRMEAWLGIRPLNDSEGVLQDIHWSLGAIGYFPTYALGNLMSVQLFDAAKAAIPNLDEHFRAGDFSPLLGWLRTNVHQWGRRRTASEILVAATGSDLDATPWMTYLRRKYEALVAR